jgi:hypothetical protein
MPRCLKCEKELEFVSECGENINDAGYIEVTFHYGSRHDQCIDLRVGRRRAFHRAERRIEKLLASDKIQAYICDDCFEKHEELFEAYSVDTKTEETRVI